MTGISEAVILMAGQGSRLRGSDKTPLKPFVPVLGRPLICYTIEAVPVLGRPLICYTIEALIRAGIGKVSFIVGYQSDRMTMGIKQLIPSGLEAVFIPNWEWRKQNGISVLAAANHITSPFLLTMSDHLFEQSILDLLLHNPALDELNLAIDRKVDSIFDSDDAMKVQTRGDRILEIGKDLVNYDAIEQIAALRMECDRWRRRAKLVRSISELPGGRTSIRRKCWPKQKSIYGHASHGLSGS